MSRTYRRKGDTNSSHRDKSDYRSRQRLTQKLKKKNKTKSDEDEDI
jgi:hypothetical protein